MLSKSCTVIDPTCFHPYDETSATYAAIAGTEVSVLHLSGALGWNVFQHNRQVSSGRFHPISKPDDAQVYIVLRDPSIALKWAESHPHSEVYLWLHDLCPLGSSRSRVLANLMPRLLDRGISVVTVSGFHQQQLRQVVASAGFPSFPIHRIYNPVVVPDLPSIDFDPNQLIFFSSPHKGLDSALRAFAAIRSKFPSVRLLVANPGYFSSALIDDAGVTSLGPLPRAAVLAHVKASLCTLFPNYVYAETFGLVLAESNAVGTPVLTHDLGAAAEVLADDRQILGIPRGRMRLDRIQARLPLVRHVTEALYTRLGAYDQFVAKISEWRSGSRPSVQLRHEFLLDNVVSQWRRLVEGEAMSSWVDS